VKLEADETAVVGISDHAQAALGDVVYVELPEVGSRVAAGDEMAVVESVKAASDIYAPVTGEITAVNMVLEDAPETVNEAPFDTGWFVKIRPDDAASLESLLLPSAYQALCESEA
jgi:glycine cleavage system H protein